MNDPLDVRARIERQWRALGLGTGGGASRDSILSFERREGAALSLDVTEYFLRINGMLPDTMDKHMYRFWQLAEVRGLANLGLSQVGDGHLFVFADWSIGIAHLAVRLEQGAPDEVFWSCGSLVRVALTFNEFLDKYLEAPQAVLFPR